MPKKTYTITNMECPNCAMILESIEDNLPGIRETSASYKKGQVMVAFDEGQVSEAEIVEAIQKMGYVVNGVKTD
jgi:copper chaperone CopZ